MSSKTSSTDILLPFLSYRACIRPEISRTHTFGDKGVSAGQFYKQHLQYIKLNSDPVDFTKKNLTYLREVGTAITPHTP